MIQINSPRPRLVLSAVMLRGCLLSFPQAAALLLLALPSLAQGADPIGPITVTGRFAGSHGVLLGRDIRGGGVCLVREQGDSHRLDIGLGGKGAFVRLDTPEPREALPRLPLRVYAGEQEVQGGRVTDRFKKLSTFAGEAEYVVPDRAKGGFTLLATSNPAGFLAVVAAARNNFLVVEQVNNAARDYVAVYTFDPPAAAGLATCRRQQGG